MYASLLAPGCRQRPAESENMMSTLDEILKAAAKQDGKATEQSDIQIRVVPASFKSDGRGRYSKGEVVRQIRVGRLNVSAFAVEAILREFGVWDKVAPAKLAAMLALPDES